MNDEKILKLKEILQVLNEINYKLKTLMPESEKTPEYCEHSGVELDIGKKNTPSSFI